MKNLLISIKLHVLEFCYMFLHQMGFDSMTDLGRSILNVKLLMYSSNIVLIMSVLSKFSTDYLGLNGHILSAFMLLIILQFITGILAVKKKGGEIEDRKIIKIAVRLVIYAAILFIMNAFTKFSPIEIGTLNLNIWSYLYHTSVSIIIFQLLISTFKNLAHMGLDGAAILGDFFGRKLSALIELDKNKTNKLLNKDNNDSDKKV